MKQKVLIVDNDSESLKVLEGALSEIAKIVSVNNGERALSYAESGQPDLILLDTSMSEMDGYEVCKRLKRNAMTKNIPLLFMGTEHTNSQGLELEILGFKLGALGYVIKPIQPEIIKAKVKSLLSHLSKKVMKAEPPVQKAPPPVQKAPPPVQNAPPPVQRAAQPVQKAPPPVQKAPPPVQKAPPPIQKAPPPVQRAPPFLPPVQNIQHAGTDYNAGNLVNAFYGASPVNAYGVPVGMGTPNHASGSRMIDEDSNGKKSVWEENRSFMGYLKFVVFLIMFLIVSFGAYRYYDTNLQNMVGVQEPEQVTAPAPAPVAVTQPAAEIVPQPVQPMQEAAQVPDPAQPVMARVTCDEIPKVPWWGTVTHEYVIRYVNEKYDGNWKSYESKWESQHKRMENAYKKGKNVVAKDGSFLKGARLNELVENLKKRVDIIRCLASKAEK